jgi:PAT family beta-lactamase induction signal transducer AmpG
MTENAVGGVSEDAVVAKERPWIFGLLIAPSAVVANGIIQGGVLAYLLSQHGISSGRQSELVDLLALPTMLYFLWSPITDFLVKRRTWLLIGGVSAGLLMYLAFARGNLTSTPTLVMMFLGACCSQLVVSSCGGMMGALQAEKSKRIASSFYQGGSLGFGAASVSVLVGLSSRTGQRVLGLVAAALIALPALFALFAPEQDEMLGTAFGERMHDIWVEFKATFGRWEAVPYTLCMLFPMASGAAVGLITGVAQKYGVNGDHVAWINGLGGTLMMMAGSLVGAKIPAKFSAPVVYLSLGVINAATLGILWLGPMQPSTYYAGVLLYLFTVGTAYAFFTAVVLEFMGDSGNSGSGRYSIINSLGNVPVLYMIRVDGWGADKWGARGLPGTECVVGGVGGALLLAYFLLRKKPMKTVIPA